MIFAGFFLCAICAKDVKDPNYCEDCKPCKKGEYWPSGTAHHCEKCPKGTVKLLNQGHAQNVPLDIMRIQSDLKNASHVHLVIILIQVIPHPSKHARNVQAEQAAKSQKVPRNAFRVQQAIILMVRLAAKLVQLGHIQPMPAPP